MMNKNNSSILQIRGLELTVTLGWPEKERQQQQIVMLDLTIEFSAPPKACETDNLKDTLCYSDLINEIRKHIANKNYHLIEYLSRDIFSIVKNAIPKDSKAYLSLNKHPAISGLTGGVNFSYFDAS